jgi:DNA-binding SARP family transcriptional activator
VSANASPAALAPARALNGFPDGDALARMIDHPDRAVRRSTVLAALAAVGLDQRVVSAAVDVRAEAPPLAFTLFGGFTLHRAGWELDDSAWQRPMAARVVRFLLTQGSSGVPEDVLFDAFWSDRDADAARQHLAVAVCRARKVLDVPGAERSVLEVRERTYRLRLGDADRVDTVDFERAAAAALAGRGSGRRAALEAAAALWTGEPLPEDRYAAWSKPWRERLVDTYCHVLVALVEAYAAAGEHHYAIDAARRVLELDSLHERAHRELMTAYARAGRTSQALRQFLECRRLLVEQLGIEPSSETSALQARILAGESV